MYRETEILPGPLDTPHLAAARPPARAKRPTQARAAALVMISCLALMVPVGLSVTALFWWLGELNEFKRVLPGSFMVACMISLYVSAGTWRRVGFDHDAEHRRASANGGDTRLFLVEADLANGALLMPHADGAWLLVADQGGSRIVVIRDDDTDPRAEWLAKPDWPAYVSWRRVGYEGPVYQTEGELPRMTPVTLDCIDARGAEVVAHQLGLSEAPNDGAWAPASPQVALRRLALEAA